MTRGGAPPPDPGRRAGDRHPMPPIRSRPGPPSDTRGRRRTPAEPLGPPARADGGRAGPRVPKPWRVEGMPGAAPRVTVPSARAAVASGSLIGVFLLINWFVMSLAVGPPTADERLVHLLHRPVPPLTTSRRSRRRPTPSRVNSPRTWPTHPGSKKAEQVELFTTQRPFVRHRRPARDAGVQGRHRQRQLTGRTAVPLGGRSSWDSARPCSSWGLLLWVARRGAASLGGGGLGVRPVQGDALRADAGPHDVRGRRGDRRGEGGAGEIVDFLRRPERYRRLGGGDPRGGAARRAARDGQDAAGQAVAGEAGVPFFSLSGGGVRGDDRGGGGGRVRDLFAQAKKEAPAIMFIDELDAIGRARGGVGFGGGSTSGSRP